jgi:hypothetical protein
MMPSVGGDRSAEVVMAGGDGHHRPRPVRLVSAFPTAASSDLELSIRGLSRRSWLRWRY